MEAEERAKRAARISDIYKESYLIGESEYPGIGNLIDTWKGPMVVIAQGYGGRGWVRCVALDRIEQGG